MSTKKIEEGSTAHKHEPAPAGGPPGGGSESMPMGMTGLTSGGDPDQKSTHVKPNTVESTLPDGSPKYADPVKSKPATRTKRTGRYEVVTRVSTATAFNSDGVATKRAAFEPGDVVELDADEAESLGAAVKPAR
jgi:hypothetical protein